jgi:hypothetical protein
MNEATGTMRALPAAAAAAPAGQVWRRLLETAFLLCNGARVLAYLPTLWAIHASGDTSQHSLWTWGTWMMANLTMGLWLFERDRGCGGRLDRAVLISVMNGVMCLSAVLLILWLRR